MLEHRAYGTLLHLTSLPSSHGIGDLGGWAYRFADFLSRTGQSYWQILPLNPTEAGLSHSPYSSFSAFGGNTLLISLDLLLEEGLVTSADLQGRPDFPKDRVDFETVVPYKNRMLEIACDSLAKKPGIAGWESFDAFCRRHAGWLDDFALFKVLKRHFGGTPWSRWPEPLRRREEKALAEAHETHRADVQREKLAQYLFFAQYGKLKKHCNEKGIEIIGDVPIYVTADSVDVWANPTLFKLNEEGEPVKVAGVPPDYFSRTGQLWGNPIYDWDRLREEGYAWWLDRMGHNLSLGDIVRVDHFRGFAGYWEVDAHQKTAMDGRWMPGPSDDFFLALQGRFSNLPIIAEDLGLITDDVRELMQRFGLPGMRVLQFAFDAQLHKNSFALHNHIPHCLVYTGTHDNNTTLGWFDQEIDESTRKRLFAYLGRTLEREEVPVELVRLAMMSVANTVILPMQDLLGLGAEARMNHPSTSEGNWKWRMLSEALNDDLANRLSELGWLYRRLRWS